MSHLTSEVEVERFSFRERLTHWGIAVAFVYTALTGLTLWTPALFAWAGVFGGGVLVRSGHPWGGVVFVALLAVMVLTWARTMRLDADDRRWLAQAHRYAVHDDEDLPDSGRFNAGQKLLFWSQGLGALVLLGTGVVLWWPADMPRALRIAAIVVHPIAGVVGIVGIMVHIYMATAATPGSLGAMLRGTVSRRWAASHHPKWNREISSR